MKLIIDIPEDELTEDEIEEAKRIADDCFSGVKTIIPDNATNGDVIKAMFPDAEIHLNENDVFFHHIGFWIKCNMRWWNAPYQKGGTTRKNCEYRHENGNCLKVGGFCTSVDDEHCVKGGK